MGEWLVEFHGDYWVEFNLESIEVQDEIFALARLLAVQGPQLKRPHCDTLNGSRFSNMKELRFSLPDGEWRVAFAFDSQRHAILLVGGSKSGVSSKRFYRDLIRIADQRFSSHLNSLKGGRQS
jgi:hypothetical protein